MSASWDSVHNSSVLQGPLIGPHLSLVFNSFKPYCRVDDGKMALIYYLRTKKYTLRMRPSSAPRSPYLSSWAFEIIFFLLELRMRRHFVAPAYETDKKAKQVK
ncbi:hypothetical protein F4776DRAFT_634036 [Hypoxylon sp. NC0597]|nr:hypothetical protein F4776DRAFT_634036 [Hypoxylon sp. NC0597]